METKNIITVTHGGAGSKNEYSDGTEKAAHRFIESVRNGTSVTRSVCHAVAVLEDDSRFNAGIGSAARSDGTVAMDAALMDSAGTFGAVAALSGYRNPIYIAEAVSQSKCRLIAGDGAAQFAQANDFQTVSPEEMRTGKGQDFSSKDTVGCVGYDGQTFAAALSTGGIRGSLPGRVGDVPLIGCGLYAGPQGAVAATGDGEAILMRMTAIRAYQLLEAHRHPEEVVKEVLSWFSNGEAVGLILIGHKGHAGGSNQSMAWSARESHL